jgi:SMC interacting uncharacterized protein involved in chromosome segregation
MPSQDTQEKKAKAKAVEDELGKVRARLDQLVKQAADEKLIERETTEKLTWELTSLRILEEQANMLKISQLVGRVRVERDRCREALGLVPARRRR